MRFSSGAPAASSTWCPIRRRAVVPSIDPVLDYDEKSGSIATASADALLAFVREQDLTVEWILDTHPHADHFSAAGYLKDRTGAKTAIGERVVDVQRLWKEIYNLADTFPTDGSQWDRLFADGDVFPIGTHRVQCSVLAGAYARLRHLCDRRCGLHPRHALHAGFRNGAVRLSRRRRAEPCGGRSSASSRCRMRPACSPATTTCPAGVHPPGRARSRAKRLTTFISCRPRTRTSSSPCAKRATRSCRCRSSSCTRSR